MTAALPRYRKQPSAWCFVSGKIAALEPEILTRAFFEEILRCHDLSAARSVLAKSGYRSLFPDDQSVAESGRILDSYGMQARAEILKLCPAHPVENYFSLLSRYRTFRILFGRLAARHNAPADEFADALAVFADHPGYAAVLAEHQRMVYRTPSPQASSALERSLYLDSVACTLMMVVGQSAQEKLSRAYLCDRAVLAAWSALRRSKANGVDGELARKWFVFGQDTVFAAEVLAAEPDPRSAVLSRLSTPTAAALAAADVNRMRQDIDAVCADALRDLLVSCRRTPFGPERVVSYLAAQETEIVNLELSLGAVANDINRDVALSRLRREHA